MSVTAPGPVDALERLLRRERREEAPELRPAARAGERQPQGSEIAADGLQLPHDCARIGLGESVRGSASKLGEADKGRQSVGRKDDSR